MGFDALGRSSGSHLVPASSALARRRLATSRRRCDTPEGEGAFGRVELTESRGVVELRNEEYGYDGYLFCEWLIAPLADRHKVTLVFERFNVACCGSDALQAFQLTCRDPNCTTRRQTSVLTFPSSFSDAGRAPPTFSLTDNSGYGVQALLRFTSSVYTGALGFVMQYTSNVFDALLVTPQLVPVTMLTRLTVYGTGFDTDAELSCRWSAREEDLILPARVVSNPDSVGGREEQNTTIECVVEDSQTEVLTPGAVSLTVQYRLPNGDWAEEEEQNDLSLVVYEPPRFLPLPADELFYIGQQLDLVLHEADPAWEEEGADVKADYHARFVDGRLTSEEVQATFVAPDQLRTTVPVPLRSGDNVVLQIEVSLNGQQFHLANSSQNEPLQLTLQPYCSPSTTIRGGSDGSTSGLLQSHGPGGAPRPFSSCLWLLEGDSSSARVTLQVLPTTYMGNIGREYIEVYDGSTPILDRRILRWPLTFQDLTGDVPDVLSSTGSAMLVRFRCAGAEQGTRFDARYWISRGDAIQLVDIQPRVGPQSGGTSVSLAFTSAQSVNGSYECVLIGANRACSEHQRASAAVLAGPDRFDCHLPPYDSEEAVAVVNVSLRSANISAGQAECVGSSVPFSFVHLPEIEELEPRSGAIGTSIRVVGHFFVDPTSSALDGVAIRCRFDGRQVVTATWLNESMVLCEAPAPASRGIIEDESSQSWPNPLVLLQLSNDGEHWSEPLHFRYREYCGGRAEFHGSIGSFSDHAGGEFALPFANCEFIIVQGNVSSGGVELTFESIDWTSGDVLRVSRTTELGEYQVIFDAATWYRSDRTNAPRVSSRVAGEAGSGLPLRVEFRTGTPGQNSRGFRAVFAALEAVVESNASANATWCPLPVLSCPTAAVEGTELAVSPKAFRLRPGADVSGVLAVGSASFFYLDVELSAATTVVEVELETIGYRGGAGLVLTEAPDGPLNASSVEGSAAGDDSCFRHSPEESLGGCPAADFTTASASSTSWTSSIVNGFVRLSHCVQPSTYLGPATASYHRFVLAAYALSGTGQPPLMQYRIKWWTQRAPDLLAGQTTLRAQYTSLQSVPSSSLASIGYLDFSSDLVDQVLKLEGQLAFGGSDGRLLWRRDACPSEKAYDYLLSPGAGGSFLWSISDCSPAGRWYVALQSVQAVNESASEVPLDTEATLSIPRTGLAQQSFRRVLPRLDVDFRWTQCGLELEGDGSCPDNYVHYLVPGQTQYFTLVSGLLDHQDALRVDVCVVDESGECDETDSGLLRVTLMLPSEEDACSEPTEQSPTVWIADGSVDEFPMDGRYRLTACVPSQSITGWPLLIHALAKDGDSSDRSSVPYRISVSLQGDAVEGSPERTLTEGSSARWNSQKADLGQWMYYTVRGPAASELVVATSGRPNDASDTSSAPLLQLHGSLAGCPRLSTRASSVVISNPVDAFGGQQQLFQASVAEPRLGCDGAEAGGTVTFHVGVLALRDSVFDVEVTVRSRELEQGGRQVVVAGGVPAVYRMYVPFGQVLSGEVRLSDREDDASSTIVITDDLLTFVLTPESSEQTCAGSTDSGNGAGGGSDRELVVQSGCRQETCGLAENPELLLNITVSDCSVLSPSNMSGSWWSVVVNGTRIDEGSFAVVNVAIALSSKAFGREAERLGSVLRGQWNHFNLETSAEQEGTLTLIVEALCASPGCPYYGGSSGQAPLRVYATQEGCADGDSNATVKGNRQGWLVTENLCTERNSRYFVGIQGAAEFDPEWEGRTIDYKIRSVSREQTNLANLPRGEALPISLQPGDREYHFFVLPDPPYNTSNYPADLVLTVRALESGVSVAESVTVYVGYGKCSEVKRRDLDDGDILIEDDELKEQYTQLIDLAEQGRNASLCPRELETCAAARKRCDAQGSASCLAEAELCCFDPKLFIAVEATPTYPRSVAYELEPSLRCSPGYEPAESGNYADSCVACAPGQRGDDSSGEALCTVCPRGTFQSQMGQTACDSCRPGYKCPDFGEVEEEACNPGEFAASPDSIRCDACPVGKYNPNEAREACEDCPGTHSTTGSQGSTLREECICESGHYPDDDQLRDGTPCRACDELQFAECIWDTDDHFAEAIIPNVAGKRLPYPISGTFQKLDEVIISQLRESEADGNEFDTELALESIRLPLAEFKQTSAPPFTRCQPSVACDEGGRWWSLERFQEKLDALEPRAANDENVRNIKNTIAWVNLQCSEGYINDLLEAEDLQLIFNAPCGTCDSGYFGVGKWKREGKTCTPCQTQEVLIILLVVVTVILVILIYYAAKSSFNWGAITISLNFLQVTSIFVDFEIDWPPEIVQLIGFLNVFRIEISSLSPECFGTVNFFQMWLLMVLLPLFLLALLVAAAICLQLSSWLLSQTRWPLWFKRKFHRILRPPKIDEISTADSTVDKLSRRLMILRQSWRYSALSLLTTPLDKEIVDTMYDQIWNTIITFLSIYYMTGCSRAMEALICQEDDFVRTIDPVSNETRLEPRKKLLTYSNKKVTCQYREWNHDNTTLSDWKWYESSVPAKSTFLGQLGVLDSTPSYLLIFILAICFTLLYAVGIPAFFAMRLYKGRHMLNHLRFGRRYGYLYKRYDVDWYFWEIVVMLRKVMLSVVRLFLVLPNGEPLPVQQTSLAMIVMLIFLCAQAFALPYCEGHLDVLETVLLTVNYIFLFIGLSYYLIERQPEFSSDEDLAEPLRASMLIVLIIGIVFIVFFTVLDVTLQLVRLYYRFIEGEGKYGSHQLLVLTSLDKEARQLQALGMKFVASQRRQQFQQWLNNQATDEERLLLKAAFSSLNYFCTHSVEHAKPSFPRSAFLRIQNLSERWHPSSQSRVWKWIPWAAPRGRRPRSTATGTASHRRSQTQSSEIVSRRGVSHVSHVSQPGELSLPGVRAHDRVAAVEPEASLPTTDSGEESGPVSRASSPVSPRACTSVL